MNDTFEKKKTELFKLWIENEISIVTKFSYNLDNANLVFKLWCIDHENFDKIKNKALEIRELYMQILNEVKTNE